MQTTAIMQFWSSARWALSTGKLLLVMGIMLLFTQGTGRADAINIDFETFPDGSVISDSTSLTTQFPSLTFVNTMVITAGISLNESEFPPHSGQNVATDVGGPITISFESPVYFFAGYFTYSEPLTVVAFDIDSNQVAETTSLFSSNEAISGNAGSTPNELLSVGSGIGISSVTITGDPSGGSFTMDDITTVPEPGTLTFVLAVATLWRLRRKAML